MDTRQDALNVLNSKLKEIAGILSEGSHKDFSYLFWYWKGLHGMDGPRPNDPLAEIGYKDGIGDRNLILGEDEA